MTYSVNNFFASNIHAVQTTRVINNNHNFDVHPDHVQADLKKLLQSQFILPHKLVLQQQEHKDRAIEYNMPPNVDFRHRADACFTRQKNTVCAVMTADCLPVLLADTNGQWVAAIHCGWRSLDQNIIAKTFNKIKAKGEYTQAYLGPCIQQENYEVSADFVANFLKNHPTSENDFSPIINGKSLANLQQIARRQLNQLNILQVMASPECTYSMKEKYHSWRRDQSSQRMASLIWMT